jgi:hypothetical protein
MSTFTPVQIRCEQCGREFVVEVLEGIHITRLPEVREKILSGRFQFFACPSCGTEVHVENDAVYTDFDKKHYVAVQASALLDWRSAKAEQAKVFTDSFDHGPSVAQELGEGFVHRLVPDMAALREKLVVWDAGLDDRAVEATKGARQRQLGVEHWDELWRVSQVLDGGHLVFARLQPLADEGFRLAGHETVTNDAYAPWAQGDELQWEFSLLLDDWVVDLYIQAASTRPDSSRSGAPPGPRGREWVDDGTTYPMVEEELPPPSADPPVDIAQPHDTPPAPADPPGPPPDPPPA